MLTVLRDNGEKWVICGGRRFADEIMFDDARGDLMRQFGHPSCIIHGGAAGADSMAGALGKRLSVGVQPCPANWAKYGRGAGPIRNKEMLALQPAKVIAFPGGRGTANMVDQARAAGITVVEIKATK